MPMPMPVVALLVLDGVPGNQLTTPGLVFDAAAGVHPPARTELRVCSVRPAVATAGPLPLDITAPWGTDGLEGAGTVVLAGHDGFLAAPPPGVLDAVRAAAARGSRVAAVGTGTFTLAASGLLDGHRATTEWCRTAELAARHPRVAVDPAGALVTDGPFLTSAGLFGGIDLFLHLIGLDHGPQVAARTARQLIDPLYEDMGATREEIDRELADTAGLEPTMRWLETHPHDSPTLAEMAAHARTSVRSLNRRFRERTGLTPRQYLLRARLERARRLLAAGDGTIEEIAARTGFGSPASFRHHFRRLTGTTPRAYRASHGSRGR
ncbi:GlxA family transcriptional regulator [Streptomyces yaizuensis]|uniref:Helix-turn-helix domain-containing protein n=1 Tax=Streptomyces yaizuensis TaxID=2989713 RepID=A0ABQ5PAE7_9ACTN|nr:helix-turn-helix domain-containing protein [Streptomyces sp. YSPA8]GLF99555.1 helix-turn-helix domain-containing protein [Streptomyces sp. YSPA8]